MNTSTPCFLYTHLVRVIRVVPGLGELPQEFRTTDDAVEFHRASLAAAVAKRQAVSFTISRIGA